MRFLLKYFENPEPAEDSPFPEPEYKNKVIRADNLDEAKQKSREFVDANTRILRTSYRGLTYGPVLFHYVKEIFLAYIRD